ncbi:MAG: hypothetical protein EAZ61_03715, partial [Oscillatoriales cyanobacterium]
MRSRLIEEIGRCEGLAQFTEWSEARPPIPLTLDRQALRVRYRCAIAQRLAAIVHRSPVELANQIVTAWHQEDHSQDQRQS